MLIQEIEKSLKEEIDIKDKNFFNEELENIYKTLRVLKENKKQ